MDEQKSLVDDNFSLIIDSQAKEEYSLGELVPVNWRGKNMMLEVGSAEWRDYQADQFDYLVENPNKWVFVISSEQKKMVREAHCEFKTSFGRLPDVGSLRIVISNRFTVKDEGTRERGTDIRKLSDFWSEFVSDMPRVLKAAGATHSLNMVWIDRKINTILDSLNLPYISWDESELAANIRIADSLRVAADGIDKLELEGYFLFHTEVEDPVVRWYFRKEVRNET